jgi:hypothetical protein
MDERAKRTEITVERVLRELARARFRTACGTATSATPS